MATEAQIRANQANAQKSTGPNTDEGKARVAGNARKHGFTSDHVMLTCPEDKEAYDELVADYRAQYPFRHAQRDHLIATLANAEMQIRLINRAKIGAMQFYQNLIYSQLWGSAASLPEDPEQFHLLMTQWLGIAFLRDAYGENVMLRLNRYETEQQRIWNRAATRIEQLYFRWKDLPVPDPIVEETVPKPVAETAAEPAPEPVEGVVTETNPISTPNPPEIQPKPVIPTVPSRPPDQRAA